ncbi:MAG: hypothetical protein WBG86_11570 [Polyangiales bacterium]
MGSTTRWLGWALLLFLFTTPLTVSAQDEASSEAPRLFADIASSTRIYPNADAALTGFELGSFYRPFSTCIHFAGEVFARFGRKDGISEDLKMRTSGAAVGALWGNGDWDRWFGAGVMFDLGWARVASRNDFVSSAYLRALLNWRLRKEFWLSLDLRAGHVIAPVTVGSTGIKGPVVGLGIGVSWGKDDD